LSIVTVTWIFCEQIADVRRWAKKIHKKNLIYMDETQLKLNEAPRTTLVAPGETEYVIVEDNTSYAARYDMICFMSGEKVFPAIVYSPEDRASRGVKGITSDMLNEFIVNQLGPSLGAYDRYPLYIICDRSTIHNIDKMNDSFIEGYCHEVKEIRYMPSKSAKRLSPLDNGLFHDWKERCRKHSPLTKKNIISVMITEWERTTSEQLFKYYKHCGLTYSRNVYADCPNPHEHKHA
jgi:hypothetical protein